MLFLSKYLYKIQTFTHPLAIRIFHLNIHQEVIVNSKSDYLQIPLTAVAKKYFEKTAAKFMKNADITTS